ncbi:MAG: hypothetical protein ACOYM3_34285, partial [Terrimicrobiaceae bacterium]
MVDWGGGRSAQLEVTTTGTKEQAEPKWSGWKNAGSFDGKETADWYDAKHTTANSEVFTATAAASAGTGSVEIELFDGLLTTTYIVDAAAAGADAFPEIVRSSFPEWMSKWKAGAAGKLNWTYVDKFQNGEEIGVHWVGTVENLSVGYESVQISGLPIPVGGTPVTVTPKIDLSSMEAKLSGDFNYDESKAEPFVSVNGKISGSGNVSISAVGSAGPVQVTGGGKGDVKVWAKPTVRDGKIALDSIGVDIAKVKTF